MSSTAKNEVQRFLAAVPRRVPVPRAVALCYHSVAAERTRVSTGRSVFRNHMSWIAEHCDVVPFDELGSSAIQDGDGRRPAVAITFDDGYDDNYREVFPVLVKHRFPATFFITTGLVDGDRSTLDRLVREWGQGGAALRPLSVEQLREMDAAGCLLYTSDAADE